MTDQSKLDAALLQVHRCFNEGEENYLLNNDQESKELIAILATRGLIHCNVTKMVAGNLRIRWTQSQRITAAGLQRLDQIQK